MKTYKNVDAYIKSFPKDTATKLSAIRRIIQTTAKNAEEKISYGMAGYKLHGKVFMYFGGFKQHVSIFAMPSAVQKFKKDLAPYKTSKGTIQFPLDRALPRALIKKIVLYRVSEQRAVVGRGTIKKV